MLHHRLIAVALGTALIVPAAASAKPMHRDYGHTFPIASRLCAKVADGKLPKRLEGSSAALTAACAKLQSDYDAAVATATPSLDAYNAAVDAAKASAKAACTPGAASSRDVPVTPADPSTTTSTTTTTTPGQGQDQGTRPQRGQGQRGGKLAACKQAIKDARASVKTARETYKPALQSYRDAIKTARHTFWGTVKGLRGSSSLTPDRQNPSAQVPGTASADV